MTIVTIVASTFDTGYAMRFDSDSFEPRDGRI